MAAPKLARWIVLAAAALAACEAGRQAPPPAPAEAPTGLIAATPVQRPWRGFIRGTLAAASGGDIAFVIDTQATLRRDADSATPRFVVEGTQTLSVTWIRCTASASPAAQVQPPGTLVIDDSVSPPTYRLEVGSLWDTTIHGSCPNGSASVPMRVPGRLEAAGTLSADGSTIEGRHSLGELAWEWSFSRPP